MSVINLSFPTPPSPEAPLFPAGFGYLIPRSVKKEMNPHQVLGVIFDSDVMPGVDDTISAKPTTTPTPSPVTESIESTEAKAEETQLQTKISVLLGGSYWLPLPSATPSPLPTSTELKQAALSTLALHFPSTNFPPPLAIKTSTHIQCIPQPPIGHHLNMKEFGRKLREAGRVGVVGGGTGAVGVNGAVKAAWEVGSSFAESLEGGQVKTGVEMWE